VAQLPRISDYLCAECQTHFDTVKQLLTDAKIPFKADASLVRGFDYYTRTVFEVLDNNIGAQSAILGGGRYDNLVEELGGPPTPAVGMGVGMERLILAMEANGISFPAEERPTIYALALDEASISAMFDLVQNLRGAMIAVEFECRPRSVKAGLKAATRVGAKHALIMGSNELDRQIVQWKNLDSGEQKELPTAQVADSFRGI
jgi:histidyl-tRNA synthetase